MSFATENQRKIVRDIVKHARRPVKARVIPPKIIQKYFKRISELAQDVARILAEESAEKEVNECIARCDINGDGYISYDEFVQGILNNNIPQTREGHVSFV